MRNAFSPDLQELYLLLFNKAIKEKTRDLSEFPGIKLHTLPEQSGDKLQMFQYNLGTTVIDIDEYSDYRNLPSMSPKDILPVIEELAAQIAEHYYWLVRLTQMKGGSNMQGKQLHVTDLGSLRVNVVERGPSCCLDANPTIGWVSYRFKFAGAKVFVERQ